MGWDGHTAFSDFVPCSRDRCGLYQNLDVSWTNLTLVWFSCKGCSRRGIEFEPQGSPRSLWEVGFFKGHPVVLQPPYTWGLGDIWERRCKGDVLIGASGWW